MAWRGVEGEERRRGGERRAGREGWTGLGCTVLYWAVLYCAVQYCIVLDLISLPWVGARLDYATSGAPGWHGASPIRLLAESMYSIADA